MKTVHEPEPKHRCGPNMYGIMQGENWSRQAGTVIECEECGKSWVAHRPHPRSGYMGSIWRPEGFFARRRRLKKKK